MRALVTTFTLVGISLLIGIPLLTESAAFSSEPETVIDKRMRAQRSAARPRSVTAPRFRVGSVGLRPAARAVRASVPRSTASPVSGRRYGVPQGLRRGTDGGWHTREANGRNQPWVQGLTGWQRFSPSNGTVGGPWSQRNGNTGNVTRTSASGSGRYGSISDTNIRASSAARVPVRDLAPQQPPWGLGSAGATARNNSRRFVASMPATPVNDALHRLSHSQAWQTVGSLGRRVGNLANDHGARAVWNAANVGTQALGTPILADVGVAVNALGAAGSASDGDWTDAGARASTALGTHAVTRHGPQWAREAMVPIRGISAVTHFIQAVTNTGDRDAARLYEISGGWDRREQQRQAELRMMRDSGDRVEVNQNRFPAEMPRSNFDTGAPYGYMRPYGQ